MCENRERIIRVSSELTIPMAGRINKGRQKQEEMTDITMKPMILLLDGCLAARQLMKPLTPKKTPHQTPAKLSSIPM
jgi:hypothetical protein